MVLKNSHDVRHIPPSKADANVGIAMTGQRAGKQQHDEQKRGPPFVYSQIKLTLLRPPKKR
jgi:hypothetical protein